MVDPATTRKKQKFEAIYVKGGARVALFTLVSYKVGELRGRHVPHIMPADAVAHVNANASLSTTFVLSSGASTCVRTGSHHCTVPASVTLLLARTPPSLNSHRLGRALLLFRSHSPVFSPVHRSWVRACLGFCGCLSLVQHALHWWPLRGHA